MTLPALVDQLKPLAFLLGTWRGSGSGVYPTIDDFTYEEEAVFTHTGRAFLIYVQKTWDPATQRPMHSETGVFRALDGGRIEMVMSHAFGIAEVAEGSVSGSMVETSSTALVSTGTAKTIDAVARRMELVGDELRYAVQMAFGGHALQGHLEATLKRTD